MGVHLQNRVMSNFNELGSAKASAGTILLIRIRPMCDRNVSHWSKSVMGHSHVGMSHQNGASHLIGVAIRHQKLEQKCHYIITFQVKLDMMMAHGMKNIKFHDVGAAAHLSKCGGGSQSGVGRRWRVSKDSKVLEIRI